MPHVVRELRLPADPWALARRLAGRPGLALLVSDPRGALDPDDARSSFVACDPVEISTDLLPRAGAPAPGWAGLPAAPRWVGGVPYETLRGLERPAWRRPDERPAPWITGARWHRYDAVLRVDHATGHVVVEADDARAAERLLAALRRPPREAAPVSLRAAEAGDEASHAARIRAALEYIARGDIYQVNLARRLRFHLRGSPLDLFARLFGEAPAPYGVHLDMGETTVCGCSPELCLEARGSTLRTAPIKGTRPRGAHAAEDEGLVAELEASEKERAELTMAIDLHRNDLGRVCVPGSVRVRGAPRVVRARVLSRVAEVVGRREVTRDIEDAARALLPAGSITGAPKVRAMEIIADLEEHRRGLYTGALGYVGRDGGVCLTMAIRTAVVRGGEVEYFTGGGIVAGSDPWQEVEETRWKAAQLLDLAPAP